MDLLSLFTHHPPVGDQAARYQLLRKSALVFARQVVKNTSPSREQSLAITKIQEASMFANAAIAINE